MARIARAEISGIGKKTLDKIAARNNIDQDLNEFVFKVFKNRAHHAARFIVKDQMSGSGGPDRKFGKNKGRLGRRTGQLASAVSGRAVYLSGKKPALEVGLFKAPPAIQRYGYTVDQGTKRRNRDSTIPDIMPKNARYLAMPVGPALSASGVPEYDSPREFPQELKAIIFGRKAGRFKNVAGRLVLKQDVLRERAAAKAERRRPNYYNIQSVYLLLTRAQIRPTHFLGDGLLGYLPRITEALAKTIPEDFILKGSSKPSTR